MATTRSNEARTRAEASFRKEERAKEGAKAMMEYQANSRLVREKTEKLKALRLAKEAAETKEAAEKNTQIKKMASSKKTAGLRPGKEP